MIRVFKYQLQNGGRAVVMMPKFARVLSVGNQHEELMLWALVDDTNDPESRTFFVAVTGQELWLYRQTDPFIGTVLFDNGGFVVHVFEVA